MKNNVFELVEDNNELVVIKNLAKDNLLIATNPYLDKRYDFFTVTKGKRHTLTIIYEDGSTFDFHWGEGGYTLICDSLETLRKKVCDFIEQDNHIMLEYRGEKILEHSIYFNDNFNKWQLSLETHRETLHYWSSKATDLEEFKKEVSLINCVGDRQWEPRRAITGIRIWVAK